MAAPARKSHRDKYCSLSLLGEDRQKRFSIAQLHLYEKGRHKAFPICKNNLHGYDGPCIDLIGRQNPNAKLHKVAPAEETRNAHEAEEDRDDEIDEIVARIDSGKAEKNREEDINPSCLRDFDYTGTGILSMTDFTTSFLSTCSYSSLKMTLCGIVNSDSSLMSSGIT